MKKHLLKFEANRVRRNYRGGAGIDLFKKSKLCRDSDMPEEWIASTTMAKNPGLEKIENEGLSFVFGKSGERVLLSSLFQKHPEHYLGVKHIETEGMQTGFLMKILDSSMRLHLQAHPSAKFAKEHLNSNKGKLEAYYILGVRPGCTPYIRLGFQKEISCEEWRDIVYKQDIQKMDNCFERIPVSPGDVWIVPGGLPHAIGEGLTVIEIMEPTDLVVRCEFEREGIIVPEKARFMDLEPDLAMRLFDMTCYSREEVEARFKIAPKIITANEKMAISCLIDDERINCFKVFKAEFFRDSTFYKGDEFLVGVVCSGAGRIVFDNECLELNTGDSFFIAAMAKSIRVISHGNAPFHICYATQKDFTR